MSENEPAKVETPARVTPMMRQYLELKEEHPDCILFFRLGDFYEMFFEDAVVASELLEITLTSRDKGEDGVPMCGVPHHSARGYIARLVNEGYKVAICEQVEPPGGKKLVKREVIQVVTPGLVTDLEMVDAKAPRYLFTTVEEGNGRFGFAYFDVTTGEFRVGEAPNVNALSEEISRIEPHEILLLESVATVRPAWAPPHTPITPVPDKWAEPAKAKARILEHYGVGDLGGFGLDDSPGGVRAAGILLAYVGSRHKAALGGVRPISRHLFGDAMFLGETTKKNLELFVTLSGQQKRGTLLSVIDRTRTAMGGRKLRCWVTFPLMDVGEINRRLDAVSELVNRGSLRKSVVERLRGVGDIERLAARIAIGNANARDLLLLKDSLMLLPEVSAISGETDAPLLKEVASGLDHLPALCTLLERAIAASPPPSLTEGGIIKDGYSEKVDELREIQHGGKSWISSLQAKERERTGISTLKIGFNKVFGYYIEVSRAKAAAVPEEYDRRQTLANAERYITPELKEMEAKVLGAEERAAKLEYELFLEVREAAAGYLDALRETADAVSTLDILAALAAVAVAKRFVRPTVHDGYELSIIGGRHPVVEELADGERFVPNDVKFDEEANRLLVITGPNMSGKSTILRQTALIALMAQLGSFVPAESAKVGIVDRIFTRVGASDDLARGRSTFMVEMMESAAILHNATPRSLVILDEIGRGTSTFDGLSIAWAVAEYIHELGARTLFATHYHELTDLARTMKGVANFNVAVKQWQGKIVFLRRLVEGGVSRSYGIEVAKLAGLPKKVVKRSKEILENLESGELDETGLPRIAVSQSVDPQIAHRQLDLFIGAEDTRKVKLIEELARFEVEELTPLEALLKLDEIRKRAREIAPGKKKN